MPLEEGVGGAELAENFVFGHHGQNRPLRRSARGFNIPLYYIVEHRLEALKSHAYRACQNGWRTRASGSMHCQGYR
jgi:hypothetical protein